MQDLEEAAQTVQRLQKIYEDLAVRGLRSVGADQLTALSAIREELERVGSTHLAGRVETLIRAIRNDDRGSARALMQAQCSLRVFDRLLTLQGVEAQMNALLAPAKDEEDANGDDASDDEANGDDANGDDANGDEANGDDESDA